MEEDDDDVSSHSSSCSIHISYIKVSFTIFSVQLPYNRTKIQMINVSHHLYSDSLALMVFDGIRIIERNKKYGKKERHKWITFHFLLCMLILVLVSGLSCTEKDIIFRLSEIFRFVFIPESRLCLQIVIGDRDKFSS